MEDSDILVKAETAFISHTKGLERIQLRLTKSLAAPNRKEDTKMKR